MTSFKGKEASLELGSKRLLGGEEVDMEDAWSDLGGIPLSDVNDMAQRIERTPLARDLPLTPIQEVLMGHISGDEVFPLGGLVGSERNGSEIALSFSVADQAMEDFARAVAGMADAVGRTRQRIGCIDMGEDMRDITTKEQVKKKAVADAFSQRVFEEKRHFAIFCSLLGSRLGWSQRDIGKWFGKQAFARMAHDMTRLELKALVAFMEEIADCFPQNDQFLLYRNMSVSAVGRWNLPKRLREINRFSEVVEIAIKEPNVLGREYAMLRAFDMSDWPDELSAKMYARAVCRDVLYRLRRLMQAEDEDRGRAFRELGSEDSSSGKRVVRKLDI